MLTNFTIFSVIALSASCLDNLIFPPAKLSGLILPMTRSASVIVGIEPPFE